MTQILAHAGEDHVTATEAVSHGSTNSGQLILGVALVTIAALIAGWLIFVYLSRNDKEEAKEIKKTDKAKE